MFGNIKGILLILFFINGSLCNSSFAQISNNNFAAESSADSVVTILLGDNGQSNAVGSGLYFKLNFSCRTSR
ncbi:MAG: hypothetical protein ACR2N3_03260 [Pyrinomonadaceae bacterium]